MTLHSRWQDVGVGGVSFLAGAIGAHLWVGSLAVPSVRVPVVPRTPQNEARIHGRLAARAAEMATSGPHDTHPVTDTGANSSGHRLGRGTEGPGATPLAEAEAPARAAVAGLDADVRRLALGAEGCFVAYQAEYACRGFVSEMEDPAVVRRKQDARLERAKVSHAFLLDWERDMRARLGAPPWDEERFQIAAVLGESSLALIGRDIAIPASPEATLALLLARMPSAPGNEARQRAIAMLSEFERERKSHLAAILRLIDASRDDRMTEIASARAYAIIDGKLILLDHSAIAPLQADIGNCAEARRSFEAMYLAETQRSRR